MAGSRGEEMAGIMQLILKSDLEGAKKKLLELSSGAKTERARGSIAAMNGIIVSMTKKKEGNLPSWEEEKVVRAAHQVLKNEMLDDFDKGYADTLVKYGKLLKPPRPRA